MSQPATGPGHQRLSRTRLAEWEALGLGMFITYGMSTFEGDEFSTGDRPSTTYAPSALDVDQWLSVARDMGCRYAVLTTKHVAGHALWPTRHSDYHVGTSSDHTDVVAAFVRACERTGILPGFYYCSWDNHNRFGSATPTFAADGGPGAWDRSFTTATYEDFMLAQLEELATYGEAVEWWIDIPGVLSPAFRRRIYARLAGLQPRSIVLMNQGVNTGGRLPFSAWPTDLINYETEAPPYGVHHGATAGHQPWREIDGKQHYLPGEICDTISPHWFWIAGDQVKCDAELMGIALLAKSRGCNLLLNVGPDRRGRIPDDQVAALMRLRQNLDRFG